MQAKDALGRLWRASRGVPGRGRACGSSSATGAVTSASSTLLPPRGRSGGLRGQDPVRRQVRVAPGGHQPAEAHPAPAAGRALADGPPPRASTGPHRHDRRPPSDPATSPIEHVRGAGWMTFARTHSVALVGIDGHLVEVEADLENGLPGLLLVGLPDAALHEARDRIRAAIINSGEPWPQRRITVSLSPASLPKRGCGFDLGIALAVLAAAGVVPGAPLAGTPSSASWASTARSGRSAACCRRCGRGRQAGFAASWSRRNAPRRRSSRACGCRRRRCCRPAGLAAGRASRSETGHHPLAARAPPAGRGAHRPPDEVGSGRIWPTCSARPRPGGRSSQRGRRAPSALLGPPGAGKTMLAERMPGLLPPLGRATRSMSRRSTRWRAPCRRAPLLTAPPFRAPHHTRPRPRSSAAAAGLRPGG